MKSYHYVLIGILLISMAACNKQPDAETKKFMEKFKEDMANVEKFDDEIEQKLSKTLERASSDDMALNFIFNQAMMGTLFNFLESDQGSNEDQKINQNADDIFTPIDFNENDSNSESRKAENEEKMKKARASIDRLFSNANKKLNVDNKMPNINFEAPIDKSNNRISGANLRRVASDIKFDAKDASQKEDEFHHVSVGSSN